MRGLLRPLQPILRAVRLWSDAGGLSMSAAVSFYGILSLTPLLLLLVALLGWWVDKEMLQHSLVTQIQAVVGERGAELIQQALASSQKTGQGIWATVLGFIVLVSGATGVFGELQDAFERVWSHGREPAGKKSWRSTATMKLRGIAYILAFGFLLLVSLAISAMLGLVTNKVGGGILLETALRAVNETVGFLFCTALFYGLMRLSGGARPRGRYLWLGAFVGAILFTIGRQVLTIYLSTAAVVSAYGAAGSLIVLLMWMYFSSGVLLFGAGCARAAEELRAEREASGERAPLGLPQRHRGKHSHA
ncbi:YihY/virulence factor BrkB family protein [Ramlibacter albus]|uniref:YihY/virulence factor BrkB family protein n=1 Tax=Ramlibacter albus TaxID=2079448 RepID=A0A923M457_9BURK|nr:YihY/virulence factor BrkB family protein [Ramlibacter albus]MBC5763857.1 YihY/virulence factor BrkB family protein [Ramlibacter albus]